MDPMHPEKDLTAMAATAPADVVARDKTKRGETDTSLRNERDRVDARLAEQRTATEKEADTVLEVARDRADEVVEAAREQADSDSAAGSPAAGTRRERAKEDATLESERALADSVLEGERAARKRYLADFLLVERDTTDTKLVSERAHADEAIAARDDFLATVSHDLRTLLGGMVLNAEAIKRTAADGPAGDKTRALAAAERRLASRMNRLVNDLLDVVSIDAGKLAIVAEHVEVGGVLQETIEAFESIAAAAHVSLTATPPSQEIHVKVDDGRIAQVLANLVSNAIKFTGPLGKVSLRVDRVGKEVVFTVADTGIGIPKAQLVGVFGRMRQVAEDRRGLGLGLYISQSLIEAHGGRMWAESEMGKGSAFHFALPAEPLEPVVDTLRPT